MEPLSGALATLKSLTEEAVALAQRDPAAAGGVGKAALYLAKGKIAETLRECRKAVALDPDDAMIRLYGAIAMFKRGDLEMAERGFRLYLAEGAPAPSLAAKVREVLRSFEQHASARAAQGPRVEGEQARAGEKPVRVTAAGRAPGEVLNLNWVITPHCNFTCSYCTAYDNAASYPSLDDLKSAADKIARLGRGDVKVVLTGGEPTVHPGYVPFVRYLADRLTGLTTLRTESNLSRTPRFYREFLAAMAGRAAILAFHASYHFEFTDMDRFLANARFLSEQGIDVQIRLLAHPEHMAQVRRLAHDLSEQRNPHLTLIVKTIRKHFWSEPDDRYTKDDLAWLSDVHDDEDIVRSIAVTYERSEGERSGGGMRTETRMFSPNEMIAKRLNRFQGMGCHAGAEMLSIGASGDLDRAVCFRRMRTQRPNIYRDAEIPRDYLRPVICPFQACGCPEDIAISKVRVGPG
ncbi:MAG: radical SAM protein [Alphaproteobacteria bacterium]